MSNFPRCRDCNERIAFHGSPSGGVRPFKPGFVDPRTFAAGVAYPWLSGKAYRFTDLVEQLMAQRQIGQDEAEAEVRDMPWVVPHQCSGRDD